jgi:hypothetical protein
MKSWISAERHAVSSRVSIDPGGVDVGRPRRTLERMVPSKREGS